MKGLVGVVSNLALSGVHSGFAVESWFGLMFGSFMLALLAGWLVPVGLLLFMISGLPVPVVFSFSSLIVASLKRLSRSWEGVRDLSRMTGLGRSFVGVLTLALYVRSSSS